MTTAIIGAFSALASFSFITIEAFTIASISIANTTSSTFRIGVMSSLSLELLKIYTFSNNGTYHRHLAYPPMRTRKGIYARNSRQTSALGPFPNYRSIRRHRVPGKYLPTSQK